jgi:hypothetical protein
MTWIDSSAQLPVVGQRCLVSWADQSVVHTASYFKDEIHHGFKWLCSNGRSVKHNPNYWMPCPDKPTKESYNG